MTVSSNCQLSTTLNHLQRISVRAYLPGLGRVYLLGTELTELIDVGRLSPFESHHSPESPELQEWNIEGESPRTRKRTCMHLFHSAFDCRYNVTDD